MHRTSFVSDKLSPEEIEARLIWLAEPLLTVVGYISMTELGWISSIIKRVTDNYVAAKLVKEEEQAVVGTVTVKS